MSDDYVQVAPDSTGKKVQTYSNVVGGNTVETQAVAIVTTTGTPVSLALDATLTGGSQKTKLVDSAGTNLASISVGGALKVDGSATTQPVSGTVSATQSGVWNITNVSGTVSLPTGAATETTLASLLTSSTFTTRIPTVGQKAMAGSVPVVLASDQSSIPVTLSGNVTVVQTTASNLNATVAQGAAGATAWKVDGSAVTQPVSGTVTANIGTSGSLALDATLTGGTQKTKLVDSAGTNLAAISVGGALKVDGSAVTQPVSGTFWQATQPVSGTVAATQSGTWNITDISGTVSLPTGAATETTLATLLTSSTFTTRIATLGQKAMTGSMPVVLASDQSAIPASQSGTWNINNVSGTVSLPTGAATETTLGTRLADSTFTGRIPTNGQKAMTGSVPVVLASDQSSIPVTGSGSFTVAQATASSLNATVVQGTAANLNATVVGSGNFTVVQSTASNLNANVSGTVTANIGSSGSLALDATLTGGTMKTKLVDTGGSTVGTIKAASTAAAAADTALVVAVSPNNKVGINTIATTTTTPTVNSNGTVSSALSDPLARINVSPSRQFLGKHYGMSIITSLPVVSTVAGTETSALYIWKPSGTNLRIEIYRVKVAILGGTGGTAFEIRLNFITALNGTPGGNGQGATPINLGTAGVGISGVTMTATATGAPTRDANSPVFMMPWNNTSTSNGYFEMFSAVEEGSPLVLPNGVSGGWEVSLKPYVNSSVGASVYVTMEFFAY